MIGPSLRQTLSMDMSGTKQNLNHMDSEYSS